ncbi:MAG: hypothetical protein JOZ69_18450, partial [Myxococcales bacterium]|nr:hypothetical protein [Myxococcales bacterium]
PKRDDRADADFARALRLDGDYAAGWYAKARCLLRRGDVEGAREAARRAAGLDPAGDGANVLLGRIAGHSSEETRAARAALLALTATAVDGRAAWTALAEWSRAHGDVALWAAALKRLARLSPDRAAGIAEAAEELGGIGELGEARAVAAAAADAADRPLPLTRRVGARLAVDEAIARGDAAAVRARATRGRVSLEETAGRALLAGRWSLARELAAPLVRADPGARGARLALAVASGGDVLAACADPGPADPPAAALFVAVAAALVRAEGVERARADLAAFTHAPIVAGDDRVTRPAVELSLRGALPADELPPDGLVELAALRGVAPSAALLARREAPALDERHRLLALALTEPRGDRVRALAARFSGLAQADPVVASAAALVAHAAGGAGALESSRGLLRRDASDPLLAATALRLAESAGDGEAARQARRALTAIGEARTTHD